MYFRTSGEYRIRKSNLQLAQAEDPRKIEEHLIVNIQIWLKYLSMSSLSAWPEGDEDAVWHHKSNGRAQEGGHLLHQKDEHGHRQ